MMMPEPQLRGLFRKFAALDMPSMLSKMAGRSMRSIYRDLASIGYLASYTHAGRYYTLKEIADFDEFGLWFHQDIGFSRAGTLKETVSVLVEAADAGRTHFELESLVRVRVHNTLLGLVAEGRLWRDRIGRSYLYVSADVARRAKQVERRQALLTAMTPVPSALSTEVVIAVLVEALHASAGLAAGSVVAARLVARGQEVTAEQVERIYAEFRLEPGKKTAEPP